MEAWRTGIIEITVRPQAWPTGAVHEVVTVSKRCTCGTLVSTTGVLDRAIVATDGSRYVAEFQAGLVEALLRASAQHEKEGHGG